MRSIRYQCPFLAWKKDLPRLILGGELQLLSRELRTDK